MEHSLVHSSWFTSFIWVMLLLMAISIMLCLYRIVRGPTPTDRTVALDTVGINMIGIMALLSIQLNTPWFMDAMLVIGILTFIGTVAIAKFLERRVIFDRSSDQSAHPDRRRL